MPIGSQYFKYIEEATLFDGRKVVAGDTIELVSVDQYMTMVDEILAKKNLSDQEKESKKSTERYHATTHYSFMMNWLGRGPYKIKKIGLWPCGRVMLYLDMPRGSEPGAYAESFI